MKELKFFRIFYISVIIVWTVFMSLVFVYYYYQAKGLRNDKIKHRSNLEYQKEMQIRNWINSLGGVYAQVNDSLLPSLLVDTSLESTIISDKGIKYTRFSPDFAIRSMSGFNDTASIDRVKLVSEDYKTEYHKPDDWEKNALNLLKSGNKEIEEFTLKDGVQVYRFMKPMVLKPDCLKCHSTINYKVGDIRGGVSIVVSLAEINKQFNSKIKLYFITFIIIWFIGIVVFAYTYNKIRQREKERDSAINDLNAFKDELEAIVEERTKEIIKSREKLEKGEIRYRNIVEHSTNLFYSHTINNVLTYVSPQTDKFFDCSQEEALRNWKEFVSDNPINKLGFENTQRAISTGIAQPPYELELKTLKGRNLWVEVHEAPVVVNGKTEAIVGALVDITEWKHAKQKLEQSESKFKKLFTSAPDGVCLLDKNGFIVDCNYAYASLLGYSTHELTGTHITDSLTEEFKVMYKTKFPELARDGDLLINEAHLTTKSGNIIKVRRNIKALYDSENNLNGVIVHTQDITELLKRRDVILESEKMLVQTQELGGIGSFKFDVNELKWVGSQGLYKIFEIEKDHLDSYENWLKIVHPEDKEWVIEKYKNSILPGQLKYDFNHRIVSHKSKTVKWVRTVGEVLVDKHGNKTFIIGFIQDITEKYLSDLKLRESESHLRAIFDAATEVSFITTTMVGRDSIILSVSKGTLKMLGYTEEELVGKPISLIHIDEDIKDFEKNLKKMQDGEAGFVGETKMKKKSGEYISVFHKAFPLKFENGVLVSGLAVTMDLSEVKKVQQDLRKREEQLTTLINSTPDLIYFKDGNGRWILANNTTLKLLGLNEIDCIGKTNEQLAELSSFYKEFLLEEAGHDIEVWNSGRSMRSNKTIPVLGDMDKIFDMIRIPLFEDDDSRTGILVFGRDISDRKELENRLINAKKLEAVGFMASRLAHEFKNILQSITGFSHFAQEGLDEGDRRFQDIEQIVKAAEKADAIVKNLLNSAKTFDISLLRHDIRKIILNFLTSVSNSLGENVEISFVDDDQSAWRVHCDMVHIELVLLNITLNAVDAMPYGGFINISLKRVKLDAELVKIYDWIETDRFFVITIQDNGSGMKEEVKNNLFEPFYTTKLPGKGTGLGLSSSFDIIKAHGGFIDVSSEVGIGSEFFIYLPLVE
jgi:PAS domain S-box-containing protein